MDFYLSNIDPQIIKIVNDKTANNVVHAKDDVPIQKDKKENQKEKNSNKMTKEEAKKKVIKLNELSETNNLDIYFVLEDENNQLFIKVFEKHTDRYIRVFDENEIEMLLQKLSTISGLIVDIKG